MNKNSVLYTILFGFVTTFLFVVPLSIAHNVTKPIVEFNSAIAKQRAVLASFGVIKPDQALGNQDIASLYGKVTERTVDGKTVYVYHDGERTYYAASYVVPGLWGPITAVVSFPEDLSRVRSLSVISHSETPGLGARITEAWFVEQLENEAFVNGVIGVNSLPKNRSDKNDGQIDAITGATRTSDAIAQLFKISRADMENRIRSLQ